MRGELWALICGGAGMWTPVLGAPSAAWAVAAAEAAGARLWGLLGPPPDRAGRSAAVPGGADGTVPSVGLPAGGPPPDGAVLLLAGEAACLDPDLLGRLVREHQASGLPVALGADGDGDPAGLVGACRGVGRAEGGSGPVAACVPAGLARRLAASWTGGPAEHLLEAACAEPGTARLPAAAGERDALIRVRDAATAGAASTTLRRRSAWRLAASGVVVVDPETTFVDPRARIAPGALILPFTVVEGRSEIGPGCAVGPGTYLRASRLGSGVRVWYSVLEEADVGDGCVVGPYAHLRPGSRLSRGVRVGNFVELKNATVGEGTKIPHHAYMGEVEIGAGANIGAGAVVVVWDGVRKRRSRIGDRAMVGCNANIVAPAAVADDGFVAAGSTITEDVPAGALAVARSRQVSIPGWVARHRAQGASDRDPGDG